MLRSAYSSLTPNVTYYGPNGAEYHTDSYGRVYEWAGNLVRTPKEDQLRDKHAQYTLEGKSPDGFQHAGHFIPNQFGGSGQKINLSAQNSEVDSRDYKAFETECGQLLDAGNHVCLHGSVTYSSSEELEGVARPEAYMVERTIIDQDGQQIGHDYFSWSNLDMQEFEGVADAESESLMAEYPNPGAIQYDEDRDIIVNADGSIADAEKIADIPADVPTEAAILTETVTETEYEGEHL